jgi:hypothetical protein
MKDPKTAAMNLAVELADRPDILVAACGHRLYFNGSSATAIKKLADHIEEAIKECMPVAGYGECPTCG